MTDAWFQVDALRRHFFREWDFRPDLYVAANAGGRHVVINHERHNVGTVREYIEILTAACEFVEESNPEWSRQGDCWAMRGDGDHLWRCQFKAGHIGWHQAVMDGGKLTQWPSPCLTPNTEDKDDD